MISLSQKPIKKIAPVVHPPIRLYNVALDEDGRDVVLRGSVAPESLQHLLKDEYQREAMPIASQAHILKAVGDGIRLPDLDLGMRGESFYEKDGSVYLQDQVYIIDGLQRVTSLLYYLSLNPEAAVQIGATVHLNSSAAWERERFHKLNNYRTRIAPSVLLRNMRETNRAVLTIYGLSVNDAEFPLYGRVAWGQNMRRNELITGMTLAKIAGRLHSHKAPGRTTMLDELVASLGRAADTVGVQTMRENLKAFFDLIEKAWGISNIQYRAGAAYMRTVFLSMLADVINDHHDFWDGSDEKRLVIPPEIIKKLALFPVQDPEVVRLAGSSGKARDILYHLLVDHINSGKRHKRLTPRQIGQATDAEPEDEPMEEVA